MYERISINDIIAFNQQFDRGAVLNKSSLEYAVDEANRTKSWLRGCALLVRAVLIDHVFEEGNKRTAAAIVVAYFEEQGIVYSPEAIAKAIATILLKNIVNTKTIERLIKNAIV